MGICGDRSYGEKKSLPDINYDFLIKKEIQKEGLDVYKPKNCIYSSAQIKCPICKCNLSEEEYLMIDNQLKLVNENGLLQLINKFNDEVKAPYKIDNINDLEIIYNQIRECVNAIEDNRYYKYICTSNELCQRTENQEIYIDLCSLSNLNNLKNNLSIDIDRLKADENYKNKYLNNKAEIHNIYTKKQRKYQIEEKYRPEFERNTFEKEQYDYERIKMLIKQVYEGDLARAKLTYPNTPGMIPFDYKPNPSGFWYANESNLKYSGTKKKLKKFIEDLTGENMYDVIVVMEKWEYKEFQKYILERKSDYEELINI